MTNESHAPLGNYTNPAGVVQTKRVQALREEREANLARQKGDDKADDSGGSAKD
jgi:hypothetical protein